MRKLAVGKSIFRAATNCQLSDCHLAEQTTAYHPISHSLPIKTTCPANIASLKNPA
jgi:hypothetical protein